MTKHEIEAKVSELIQPEGERKHDEFHDAQANTKRCLKCNKIYWKWGEYVKGHSITCTHPDTITICDDPNDKAYAESLGLAMVWFRKSRIFTDELSYEEINSFFEPTAHDYCATVENQYTQYTHYALWLAEEATPLQIWTIILTAIKEQ